MARPPSTPRLRDLVAAEVAADVVDTVVRHAGRLLHRVDLGATWHVTPESAGLRWTVELLVGYAQRGLTATDWQDHGCAADAILEVISALYTSAGSPQIGGGVLDALEADASADEPIGVVLLAAYARMTIAGRGTVPVRTIAALAGVAPNHVRLVARAGELDVHDGVVPCADARRWLATRGVPGIVTVSA